MLPNGIGKWPGIIPNSEASDLLRRRGGQCCDQEFGRPAIRHPRYREFAKAIIDAPSVRFDGSDAMPAAVGTGTFWSEMVKLVSGSQDIDTTLNNIEASWPAAGASPSP